jgi:uncharacterized protein (DUF1501 family)
MQPDVPPALPLRVSRQEFLQVGFSAALGCGLSGLLAARDAQAAAGPRVRAKSVIFVFCTGAPAHQDMWDLKPEAPTESRGEFKPVDTKASGVRISEHLPKLAGIADKFAIVRSMTHKLPSHEHGTHYLLTGINQNPPGATHMASRNDWPCYASGLQYLRGGDDGLPAGVHLPTYLHNGYGFCGQNAGFLGSKYDPWQITRDPAAPKFQLDELSLAEGLTVQRVSARHGLLESIDRQRRDLVESAGVRSMSQRKSEAFDMLTRGGKFREAFDLEREPAAMRDRYGRHAFGQSLLLARRLVEAGVPIVQANMGTMNRWDTHGANFRVLKDTLLPPFDQGLATLLADLDERGLLDETLVVCTGEFGRTPIINANAGRDHWSNVFSAVFAGAGVRGGQVIGASDVQAAYPATRGWYPADLGATIYSALGIDPQTQVIDQLDRPHQLNAGEVIAPLYS